jgi:hypothetical protein
MEIIEWKFRPRFGRVNTREPRNRTNLRRPKQAKKDEFQTGPKFVRYRVNGVLGTGHNLSGGVGRCNSKF